MVVKEPVNINFRVYSDMASHGEEFPEQVTVRPDKDDIRCKIINRPLHKSQNICFSGG